MSQRTRSNAYRQQQRRSLADAQNAELEATFAKLQNILSDALSRDTYIDLEKLKTWPRIELFNTAKPRRGDYLPAAPAGLNKMLPWKKREYGSCILKAKSATSGRKGNTKRPKGITRSAWMVGETRHSNRTRR